MFLDWCPIGSPSSDRISLKLIEKLNDKCRPAVQEAIRFQVKDQIAEPGNQTASEVAFDFAVRPDGLMLLCFESDKEIPFPIARLISNSVATLVKSKALGHSHHHHAPYGEELRTNRTTPFAERTQIFGDVLSRAPKKFVSAIHAVTRLATKTSALIEGSMNRAVKTLYRIVGVA